MSTWEIRKDGKAYAGGPISTVPQGNQLRSIEAAGYRLYIDGQLQRKGAGNKGGGK